MIEKLFEIKEKYFDIQKKLSDPQVISDIKKLTNYSREFKELEPVISKFAEYEKIIKEINDAKELLEIEDDIEMKEMLIETVNENEQLIEGFEDELKIMLLPKDPNDGKNAILEIRGAAGGDEANIFANDLYRMYSKYFESIGWKTELLVENISEGGGVSLVSVLVKGDSVFSKLKFESGSHRVQRVPATESQGRIHTSTATVIVMPEIEDVDVNIAPTDIRIDVYRSSGAGGQSVNTTDSAVRVTHIETNIVVSCQTERSQIQNKEHAMKVLRARLYDHYLQEQMVANDQARKSKLGTGSRSEKIRTYNYPQNRVTDHRIGLTLNKLDQVMEGKLSEVIEALTIEDQLERLNNLS
ncbi:MAG: peptide chain release factor 1 [Spiroplasma sp.]|nr:peptide chain release factor 1 [Mycoplasmatales bacterium]